MSDTQSSTTADNALDDTTKLSIIVASASGFVLLVLVVVTCICYRRWKSKNSANVHVPRTDRRPTKQNHYASPPTELEPTTRGQVKKVASSQMSSDRQHPDNSESVGGVYVTVQPMPSTSSTGQTGSSTGGATADHKSVDALYSKVKKTKRTRAANDLYSKPDKKGKGRATNSRSGENTEGGNEAGKEDLYTKSSKQKRGKSKSESETLDELYTRSAKQKRGKSKSENESETADELYTKSTKQKQGKSKSENESETDDELYTKSTKKGKKSKQADYANYNLVKDLNGDHDVSASGDVTQGANRHNGIMDNELYKK